MSQKDIIMKHLRSGQELTILKAIGVYRIYNLKARINELRDSGVPIVTTMKVDATGKSYASYTLAEKVAA